MSSAAVMIGALRVKRSSTIDVCYPKSMTVQRETDVYNNGFCVNIDLRSSVKMTCRKVTAAVCQLDISSDSIFLSGINRPIRLEK